MFRIEIDTLYSRSDLAVALEDLGITVDWFVEKYRPRSIFKGVYLGSDLIEAIRQPKIDEIRPYEPRSAVRAGARSAKATKANSGGILAARRKGLAAS